MARAFQLAGVPRVVMSLWSVDDQATRELMQSFFARLAALPPAGALRDAMLDLRKRRPEGSQWASFAVFGSPPADAAVPGVPLGSALALREVATSTLKGDGAILTEGEVYDLVLRTGPALPGALPSGSRHLTAFAVDSSGHAALVATAELRDPGDPKGVVLVRFDVSASFGVDTFILLVSGDPLPRLPENGRELRSYAELLSLGSGPGRGGASLVRLQLTSRPRFGR